MKKTCYAVGILISICVSAQNIMILTGDINRMLMKPSAITDSVEIDQAILAVKYRYAEKKSDDQSSAEWCDIHMLIGNNTVMQKDLCLYYDHLIQTKGMPDVSLSERRNAVATQPSNLFSDLIFDLRNNTMTVRCGDYFHSGAIKSYTQPKPELLWSIENREKTIHGYKCKKATVEYGGRLWEAWFTEELPAPFGPWKLHGLPGLILEASANEFFTFSCIEIGESKAPIVKFHFKSEQVLKSREAYLHYEKGCFEHPFETFANGQQAIVATRGSDGKTKYLDDTWTIPYNPIELE